MEPIIPIPIRRSLRSQEQRWDRPAIHHPGCSVSFFAFFAPLREKGLRKGAKNAKKKREQGKVQKSKGSAKLQSPADEEETAFPAHLPGTAILASGRVRLAFDSFAVLIDPGEWANDLHGLGGNALAKDSFKDGAIDVFELDHAVRRHEEVRPA